VADLLIESAGADSCCFRVPDDVAVRGHQRTHQSGLKTALRLDAASHLVRSRAAHACWVTASYCRWAAECARRSCLRYFLQVSLLGASCPWCGPSLYRCYFAPGGCAVPVRPGSMACTPQISGIAI